MLSQALCSSMWLHGSMQLPSSLLLLHTITSEWSSSALPHLFFFCQPLALEPFIVHRKGKKNNVLLHQANQISNNLTVDIYTRVRAAK